MHDSSRGSEHGDWYRCAASESALVGHRLAQAQHPTLLQASADRHKLAPEFEMQHGSAQSPEKFLGSVGLEGSNWAKAGEPKKAREAQIPADSQRVFAHPCRASAELAGALSPYRTSHSVAM